MRAIQLTYNNQNELGGSCYEDEDSGLSRTGKEIVREMNRTGILVDLSHVGNRTTRDAILWSEKPVAVTHANPDSLFPHKRNKTDDVLKALAERGGVLGCATYRNITGDHYCSSLTNWCEMVLLHACWPFAKARRAAVGSPRISGYRFRSLASATRTQ